MVFLGLLAACLLLAGCRREPAPEPTPPPTAPEPARTSALASLRFPTTRDFVATSNHPGTFQPTASGRPESALYGSTRTASSARGTAASFHEGLDIAPAARDRRGRPADTVTAIADGRVAYRSKAAGDSSYGFYVVLLHEDPLGTVYSLYSHLASIAPNINAGHSVTSSTPLGVMGNTANYAIPFARAHLHLEVGLVVNSRFGEWSRREKLKPDRGNYGGWNLEGVDPLAFFACQQQTPGFGFTNYLATVPTAFEIVLQPRQRPDYFRRYPALWHGPPHAGDPMTLRCSESGLVLGGRIANEMERAALKKSRGPVIQNVDPAVLGRNGRHLVTQQGGRWVPGRAAARWLEILTY